MKMTDNANFFCIGPSGSGKSFHMEKKCPKRRHTCFDLMKKYGIGKTQVRRFAMTHGVRMKKMYNRRMYYLKADWDEARKKAEDGSTSTKKGRG